MSTSNEELTLLITSSVFVAFSVSVLILVTFAKSQNKKRLLYATNYSPLSGTLVKYIPLLRRPEIEIHKIRALKSFQQNVVGLLLIDSRIIVVTNMDISTLRCATVASENAIVYSILLTAIAAVVQLIPAWVYYGNRSSIAILDGLISNIFTTAIISVIIAMYVIMDIAQNTSSKIAKLWNYVNTIFGLTGRKQKLSIQSVLAILNQSLDFADPLKIHRDPSLKDEPNKRDDSESFKWIMTQLACLIGMTQSANVRTSIYAEIGDYWLSNIHFKLSKLMCISNLKIIFEIDRTTYIPPGYDRFRRMDRNNPCDLIYIATRQLMKSCGIHVSMWELEINNIRGNAWDGRFEWTIDNNSRNRIIIGLINMADFNITADNNNVNVETDIFEVIKHDWHSLKDIECELLRAEGARIPITTLFGEREYINQLIYQLIQNEINAL